MNCKICSSETELIFNQKVLKKYKVNYYHCNNCKYIFTETPYWLDEAYRNPINISDTGIIERNIRLSKIVATLIYFFYNKNSKYVDYAGGYGILTRIMRDMGFDFLWSDPYTKNLFSNGFEYNAEKDKKINLLTAFEVFEHLSDPINEINKMLTISQNIAFSTKLLPEPTPEPGDWWYYGFEHGQHVSFYSLETLNYIASKLSLNFISVENFHLFTEEKINSSYFKILLKLNKLGLVSVIKTRMNSKIVSDFYMIREREIEKL